MSLLFVQLSPVSCFRFHTFRVWDFLNVQYVVRPLYFLINGGLLKMGEVYISEVQL
jgi:hypothetical protein